MLVDLRHCIHVCYSGGLVRILYAILNDVILVK